MKTQKIQNLLVVTLFCAAALAGLTACDADPVEREGGNCPTRTGLRIPTACCAVPGASGTRCAYF